MRLDASLLPDLLHREGGDSDAFEYSAAGLVSDLPRRFGAGKGQYPCHSVIGIGSSAKWGGLLYTCGQHPPLQSAAAWVKPWATFLHVQALDREGNDPRCGMCLTERDQ